MSIKLKGDNTFTTNSSGLVYDTTSAGKSIDFKTNGDSRLLITDDGFQFTQPISTTTVVGGHLLINTDTGSYPMVSTTPTNIRIWGSTENFTSVLPNALTTALGTIYTIYNTSTVQIEVWTYSAGKHVDIESDYSATFVLIDTDFDAVASWKITSQGVPPYAVAGTVLTSNGSGALPTYKPIAGLTSYGAWTPKINYMASNGSGGAIFPDTATYNYNTGSYYYTQISQTLYSMTISWHVWTLAASTNPYKSWLGMTGLPTPCALSTYTMVLRKPQVDPEKTWGFPSQLPALGEVVELVWQEGLFSGSLMSAGDGTTILMSSDLMGGTGSSHSMQNTYFSGQLTYLCSS